MVNVFLFSDRPDLFPKVNKIGIEKCNFFTTSLWHTPYLKHFKTIFMYIAQKSQSHCLFTVNERHPLTSATCHIKGEKCNKPQEEPQRGCVAHHKLH